MPASGPKARGIVCTACRQSKLRCIGPDSEACERCQRLDLECFRDAKFKRVSKSRKIAELEKQIQQLSSVVIAGSSVAQSTVSTQSAVGAVPDRVTEEQTPGSSFDLNTVNTADLGGLNLPDSPVLSTNGVSTQRPPATRAQKLETVMLSPAQTDILFEMFFLHYHPFLPFLDSLKSPDEYEKASNTLFWTIIGVASRRYHEDGTLFTALSTYVTKIIWTEVSRPPYRLETVQAILLLCTWPFPTSSTWNEPAVTLSTLAITIAMQIGLHRPINTQDFLRAKTTITESELQRRTCTWAAANLTSQALGAIVGQLPTTPYDWTVDQACQPGTLYTLPPNLRIKVVLSWYCDRVTKVMCSHSDESMGFTSPRETIAFASTWENEMAMLENELRTAELSFTGQLSSIDVFYCAAAYLYLHSFYFFNSTESESRESGILKAYDSACRLITYILQADPESGALRYMTYYLFRMLLTAACVLLKVLNSSYHERLADYEAGRALFNKALFAMSRISTYNNDTAAKAVKLLAQMWHCLQKDEVKRQNPPQLIIKSRLGASVTYDFIWSWRQEFGGVPKAYPTSPVGGKQTQQSPAELPGFFQDLPLADLGFLENWNWNFDEGGVF